jgi:hypothetical protein
MVLTLLLVARKVLGLENYITMFHIESMNKIIILTGSIVGVAYLTEFFIAWYSGSEYEGNMRSLTVQLVHTGGHIG